MGNPTSANDLAYEILKVAATDGYGIYHCTNEGTCSWADFAAAIMEGAGLDCEVCRCTSDEYAAAHPDAAHRPAFSSLDNAHLAATVGDEMRPWHDALDSFLGNLNKMEG
jgi:dTDP-4-dehydrorhamnose reductase